MQVSRYKHNNDVEVPVEIASSAFDRGVLLECRTVGCNGSSPEEVPAPAGGSVGRVPQSGNEVAPLCQTRAQEGRETFR